MHQSSSAVRSVPQSLSSSLKEASPEGGRRPRILLVTPEICDSSLLASEGRQSLCVKAGGLADVSALLLDSLTTAGADVHVTPSIFRSLIEPSPNAHSHLLHLCEDREFCYRQIAYDAGGQNLARCI